MAKKRGKSRRSYGRKRGGHKKKGIIFGLTAYDFATIGYNVEQFGAVDAAELAMNGQWREAGSAMAGKLVDNIPSLIVGNILLYVGKKVAQKVIAPAARRYLV